MRKVQQAMSARKVSVSVLLLFSICWLIIQLNRFRTQEAEEFKEAKAAIAEANATIVEAKAELKEEKAAIAKANAAIVEAKAAIVGANAAIDRSNTPIFSHISWQCFSSSDVKHAINSTDNIIIVMPAKAAGTSVKYFAKSCHPNTTSDIHDNLGKKDGGNELILTKSWDMPGVFASHFWVPERLSRLLRSASMRTLIIYIHRDETSRFKSAVNHVLVVWCAQGAPDVHGGKDLFDNIGDGCRIHEKRLVQIIAKRPQEMQMGTNELLTCEAYSSMEEYAPNMVFMDYKYAGALQNMVAEKYCPDMVGHTHHIGKGGGPKVSVRLQSGENVTLSDWLEKKASYLEWTLELNKKATCLVKTRRMEEKFSNCGGGFLNMKAVMNH